MLGTEFIESEQWKCFLESSILSDHFLNIYHFIEEEKKKGKVIFPTDKLIFNAFNQCPFTDCKVVILGQDPYHNDGQAHGLSFSVPKGIKIPPSLKNIYKEIVEDLGIVNNSHGNLENWANQGVLLLNAILTVNANEPASHRKSAWENFTDEVIQKLSNEKQNMVFILWGSFAQSKAKLIDSNKHLILKSVHPSPLSAYRGFFGSKHFSAANTYLNDHGKAAVDWRI